MNIIVFLRLLLFCSVVALGWSAVQGCGMCEGEGVEVRPVTRPVSKIPVAGQVVVAAM